MDEWHVGDPADWGDSAGVPDIPYMGYLQGDDEDDRDDDDEFITESRNLRDEAWSLYQSGELYAALRTINEAIDLNLRVGESYNVKAIILEEMGRYDEALSNYDRALRLNNSQTVKDNKARLLAFLAEYGSSNNYDPLDLINEALKITGNDDERKKFLSSKGRILLRMGLDRQAYVCFMLSTGHTQMVDEFEGQLEILKSIKATLVCIAGADFYEGFSPFEKGAVIELIKEYDNSHDRDAIRVEMSGKTVGYVANSYNTKIAEAKSATQIRDMFDERARAKILFVFMQRYPVAELI